MTHISGFERSQLLLLPEAVDDYVGPDNPVRFIDAFVDGLDLAGAGFRRVEPKATGRPGYAPADLLTVLDDFSRYIIAWKLCPTMKAEDVTATLNLALKASGLDQAKVIHRPRLLSDNGSSYISADLAKWLDGQNMEHVRGAPYHPMTQGKIERWHRTLKNRILLENYYLPGDLETQIEAFVAGYNHLRYHESIANLTPADVYFERGQTILIERERIKRQTIANRRLLHRRQVA